MLLHARGDGIGAQRGRPRSARHRVLQRAFDLRLHVVDADAVQLRHAPLAAVFLLSHDGRRRPRRHLRGDQGKRASVQVRRRAGQRLDQRARAGVAHQGHQRQVAGRGAVPQSRERHRGRGQSVLCPGNAGLHRARRAADPRGAGRRSGAGKQRALPRGARQARLQPARTDGRDRRQARAEDARGHHRPPVLGDLRRATGAVDRSDARVAAQRQGRGAMGRCG